MAPTASDEPPTTLNLVGRLVTWIRGLVRDPDVSTLEKRLRVVALVIAGAFLVAAAINLGGRVLKPHHVAEQTVNAAAFRSAIRQQFPKARSEEDWRLDDVRHRVCRAADFLEMRAAAQGVAGVHSAYDEDYVAGAASVNCP